jgi:membrane associated rhomboid family serine protease
VLPLRDTIPSATVPVVNYVLIALNSVVFLYELSLGSHVNAFVRAHGLVPTDFTFRNLLFSMFLHGSIAHVAFNMLFLYIFGDNVEDRLGHARYLAFYLLCGMAAGAAQAVTSPSSTVPMVGASGAIAGVLGAYFLFYPSARVVTLVPIFFFLQVMEVPAVFFLLIWFLLQLLPAIGSVGAHAGGVAFWAHVGGFVAGMVLGPVFRPRRPAPVRWV